MPAESTCRFRGMTSFGGEVSANAATLMARECDHRYIKQINICSNPGKVKVKNNTVSPTDWFTHSKIPAESRRNSI